MFYLHLGSVEVFTGTLLGAEGERELVLFLLAPSSLAKSHEWIAMYNLSVQISAQSPPLHVCSCVTLCAPPAQFTKSLRSILQ